MANKFGTYINKLMTTIIDKEQDDFVKELALSELKQLNSKITEFVHNNNSDEEASKETIKTLLQEEKKDG